MRTLQGRLAEVIKDTVPAEYKHLVSQRTAETVENWHQDVERRVRLTVDKMLADTIPDDIQLDAIRTLATECCEAWMSTAIPRVKERNNEPFEAGMSAWWPRP